MRGGRLSRTTKSSSVMAEGRVKVGVRCRPPFQDEVDSTAPALFRPVVNTVPSTGTEMAVLQLCTGASRTRDFQFDYSFGPTSMQDEVYNTVARPVVNDALRGYNATVLAYGQTGTGKTYTMGILERVRDEHAGIVPRALGHLFDYTAANPQKDVVVTMSFLQIYLDTIQDLLAPSAASGIMEENLAIRENPSKGFYVEGLHEYIVRSYEEAEALVNFGLENRAMAPTLMNTTSSRSHTVLTVHIEQRGVVSDGETAHGMSAVSYSHTLRGKLLLVDLAGSERVRRTTSRGTRLSEAKSINMSLSALGNVIAALAEPGTQHVPFRDSKLTRLLQDSLGGSAATALIATVGPSPANLSETLSTLLFASRCMHVKSNPIQHEEVDYAELCAKMQARLATIEQDFVRKASEQQERYESIINRLASQVRSQNAQQSVISEPKRNEAGGVSSQSLAQDGDTHWLAFANNREASAEPVPPEIHRNAVVLVALCFEVLTQLADQSHQILARNQEREAKQAQATEYQLLDEDKCEASRDQEAGGMAAEDPIRDNQGLAGNLGPHLAPLSSREARGRVEARHPSNNMPLNNESADVFGPAPLEPRPSFESFETPAALVGYLNFLKDYVGRNSLIQERLMETKDAHFFALKQTLAEQTKERRQREEEVINWSFVLKYLLSTNSKLRRQAASAEVAVGRDTSRSSSELSPIERVQLRKPVSEHAMPATATHSKLGSRIAGTGTAIAFNAKTEAAVFRDEAAARIQARWLGFRENRRRPPKDPLLQPKSDANALAASLKEESAAKLVKRVSTFTPEEIARLPDEARRAVALLRQELGLEGSG